MRPIGNPRSGRTVERMQMPKGSLMADNNNSASPMSDADITPPGDTDFTPAVPLKDAGVDFEPASGGASGGTGGSASGGGIRQQLTDNAGKLQGQAGDRIRGLADMGKERAGGALDQLAQMLTDAAGQVDAKLGAQYGGYARTAAEQVQGLSSQVKNQDLDELLESARGFVTKSPGVAIGVAAALGFVVARLVQSGIDADQA